MPNPADICAQLDRLVDTFTRAYGRPPTHAAVAPGRVNLIGEHTDYNDGFVLPMAIERQTVIVAAASDGPATRIRSTGVDSQAEFVLDPHLSPGEPTWANYIKGPLHGCLTRGLNPGPFDAMLDSTVPTGGGLSSSASLEVATATLIEALCDQALDPVDKACLSQKAEHDFAGMPCGIMDQFISSLGQVGHALLIDCRSHQTRPVPLQDDNLVVLIANSNCAHALVGGEYAQRRAQCQAAAKTLGVQALRDATMDQLDAIRDQLDATSYRRARHVITENQRTLDAADAMVQHDWATVGTLMFASHASMRDDFEITTPELDTLVELAQARCPHDGVIGSRMTGGGFGGCTVSLVHADALDDVTADLSASYERATGIPPTLFATRAAQGARILDL